MCTSTVSVKAGKKWMNRLKLVRRERESVGESRASRARARQDKAEQLSWHLPAILIQLSTSGGPTVCEREKQTTCTSPPPLSTTLIPGLSFSFEIQQSCSSTWSPAPRRARCSAPWARQTTRSALHFRPCTSSTGYNRGGAMPPRRVRLCFFLYSFLVVCSAG